MPPSAKMKPGDRSDHRNDMLLGLLSPALAVTPADLAALDADDWAEIARMTGAHRVGPLLHWCLSHGASASAMPEYLRAEAADSAARWTKRSLGLRRGLAKAAKLFAAADIDLLALKGAYLAFHAHPEPGLRPCRDLDLLVPETRALDAFDLLLANGFEPVDDEAGDPAQLLAVKHQLPPLKLTGTSIVVEVHHRVFHLGPEPAPDPADDPGLWRRAVDRPLGRARIRYMGAADLLLHLIVHAVYDHRFDNGPALMGDIAWLVRAGDLDWPLFWRLAADHGRVRGAVLALALAEWSWGPLAIDWHGHDRDRPDDATLRAMARLTLRDAGSRHEVTKLAAMSGRAPLRDRLRLARRLMLPDAATLEAAYGARGRATARPLLIARRLRHVLVERLPAYVRSIRQPAAAREMGALGALADWLAEPDARRTRR